MAASDASPFPIKNQAYRVTFPILDADGDLVTGAASLDSEVSKDGGAFADCTNEATEIAASSGMYYLDLTSTEMNADTVAIIIKTSTTGAKTTPVVLYPVTLTEAMLGTNMVQIGGVVPASHLAGTASGTPTTTTMVSDIGVTVDDQFNGRVIIFDAATATAALQNQATAITACTAASNTLTFTALTTAPASGDTFKIV